MQEYAELETSALFDKLVEYTQRHVQMKQMGASVEEITQCRQELVKIQWAIARRMKGQSKDFIDEKMSPDNLATA